VPKAIQITLYVPTQCPAFSYLPAKLNKYRLLQAISYSIQFQGGRMTSRQSSRISDDQEIEAMISRKRGFRAIMFGLLTAASLALAPAAFAGGHVGIGVSVPGVSLGYVGGHHGRGFVDVGVGGGYYGYGGGYYAPGYYDPYYTPVVYDSYYYGYPRAYYRGGYYGGRGYYRGGYGYHGGGYSHGNGGYHGGSNHGGNGYHNGH
jgi:hypothetical protein